MENQNRLKMRISRMFRSSFGSCRTRNLTDVMDKAVFPAPENLHSFHLIDQPPSPKNRAFSPVFRSETFDHRPTAVFGNDTATRRNKISECSSPFLWGVIRNGNAIGKMDGRSCPPASPNTHLNQDHELGKTMGCSARNKKKKKKKKHAQKKNRAREFFPFNSCAKDTDFGGYWWYSSDEDDETDTLFSSRSLSSDSSRSRRRRHRKNDRSSSDMGVLPLQGKVKDTFAVVKRSSDPHSDFRTSMVEMIVEKQIFSPQDLENLLQCFLSLNSNHHHKVIVEVFTEIWEALFSDWGI